MSLVNYQFLMKTTIFIHIYICEKIYIRRILFYRPFQGAVYFVGPFCYLCFTFVATVPCDHQLVRAGLLDLLCEMFPLCFATLQYGVLGQ